MRNTQSKNQTGSRRWRTASEVEEILVAYWESGHTQRVFAREAGISVSSLQSWLRLVRSKDRKGQRKASRGVTVQAVPLLEVELAGGRTERFGASYALRNRGELRRALACAGCFPRSGSAQPLASLAGDQLMFGFGTATRIYLATGATDMRKGFDGLFGLVKHRLEEDPLSGHLFFFCNRPRTRLKVLFWDGSGLWVCAKRLEQGRFSWPPETEQTRKASINQQELAMLLGGLDLSRTRRKTWWRQEAVENLGKSAA